MVEWKDRLINVLVTGVGAIIGQGIIRSLRSCGYDVKIVGIDRSDRSPAVEWCDIFIPKPACDEADLQYLKFWCDLIEEHQINIVLPGLEVDVNYLDRNRFFIVQGSDCVLALNSHGLISLAEDKWLMHQYMESHGFPVIPTMVDSGWDAAVSILGGAPILLKPRRGSGSRGIMRLYDLEDFEYWTRKSRQPWILQRIVGSDDEEYTVGVFGFGDGSALDPIILRRRLSSAGSTLEAVVVENKLIRQRVAELNFLLKPVGPTNYQFRMEGETTYLLEVNPRFSSSNSLRTGFGYNESLMSLDYFLLNKKPQMPKINKGTAWRYSEDFYVYDRAAV